MISFALCNLYNLYNLNSTYLSRVSDRKSRPCMTLIPADLKPCKTFWKQKKTCMEPNGQKLEQHLPSCGWKGKFGPENVYCFILLNRYCISCMIKHHMGFFCSAQTLLSFTHSQTHSFFLPLNTKGVECPQWCFLYKAITKAHTPTCKGCSTKKKHIRKKYEKLAHKSSKNIKMFKSIFFHFFLSFTLWLWRFYYSCLYTKQCDKFLSSKNDRKANRICCICQFNYF